jgi:hypothetical protein
MDSERILKSYLLDKGAADLADRNLLEVLKELLRKENHGIRSDGVEECSYVDIATLPLDAVAVGNSDHFHRVYPRDLNSPNDGPLITGVVIRTSRGNRIVDGYHRLKHSLSRELETGTFVVISRDEI